MSASEQIIRVPACQTLIKVTKIKVRKHQVVTPSSAICILQTDSDPILSFNSPGYGRISMLCEEGASVKPGDPLFKFEPCGHHVVMKDLCAECGANLRKEGGFCGERIADAYANIPMVHMIPELHVSESVAAEIALQDENNLLSSRKLALLIDLDQTVLHTTTNTQAFKYKNVHRFNLPGCPMIYHTRFRPHLTRFLKRMVKKFQMHICTFGNRAYAHQLASILDPKRQFFCQRILSRDECFNPITKSANLKALFPRGTHLVCIIDDRGDVWDWSPNLIQVQPYRFFPEVGDINGPPGRPLSMMPMPDFRPIPPPSPTHSYASTSSSDSEEESSTGTGTKQKPPPNPPTVDKDMAKKPNETIVSSTCSSADDKKESIAKTTGKKQSMEIEDEKKNKEKNEKEKVSNENEIKSKIIDIKKKVEDEKEANSFQYPSSISTLPTTMATEAVTNESIFEMSEDRLDNFDGDYLLRLEHILLDIHRRYFHAYDRYVAEQKANQESDSKKLPETEATNKVSTGIPHVSNVALQMRNRVFGPSIHITLSGLTPKHRPARHCLAGQLAISLGATLHNRLRFPVSSSTSIGASGSTISKKDDALTETSFSESNTNITSIVEKRQRGRNYTTHLVACRLNTEKAIAAEAYIKEHSRRQRLWVVSPRWLWACHFRWERMPESQFPLDQDYTVAMFDPDVNCFPGRYRSLSRRSRNHQPGLYHNYTKPVENLLAPIKSSREDENKNTVVPQLDPDMVKSAIESIRKEHKSSRHHHHHHYRRHYDLHPTENKKRKRNLSEPTSSFNEAGRPPLLELLVAKRVCIRKSDGDRYLHQENEQPISKKECDDHAILVKKSKKANEVKTDSDDSLCSIPPSPQLTEAEEDDFAPLLDIDEDDGRSVKTFADDAIISDADEEGDFNSEDEDDENMEGDEEERRYANTESSTMYPKNLEEELKRYLPPPCPLDLAENPLLHMPPQTTSQMLDEIEEAVLEEEAEKASTTPRELEDYNSSSSSSSSSDDRSSSSSSSFRHHELGYDIGDHDDTADEVDDDVSPVEKMSPSGVSNLDHEERWLQIRRELLLRKPRGEHAVGNNLAIIEKKLQRLRGTSASSSGSAGRLPISRRHGDRKRENLSKDHHHYRRHHHHRPNSAFCDAMETTPIESDLREWNTCPEGYDYADAEQARALLRPELASPMKTSSIAAVLPTSKMSSKIRPSSTGKAITIIGAAGCLEKGLFAPESSSDSSESSGENATDKVSENEEETSDDDDEYAAFNGEDDAVITSDALKKFM